MLNLQEENVMNALYSCAAITKNTIRKLGGDEDTILNLINKKYIKKEKIDIDNKSIAIYKLTKQGEKAYIDKFGKKYFYRCSNLRKAAELGYFYALLTEEEKATWKSKDELAQALNCSIYPDAVFTRGGIPSGVFVIKTEDVDKKLPELKEFAKEQKIKIILKRI